MNEAYEAKVEKGLDLVRHGISATEAAEQIGISRSVLFERAKKAGIDLKALQAERQRKNRGRGRGKFPKVWESPDWIESNKIFIRRW